MDESSHKRFPLRITKAEVIVLLVIAFLGFVAYTLVTPSYQEPDACMSHQHQLASYIQIYAQDHNNIMPASFKALTQIDNSVFVCPGELHSRILYRIGLHPSRVGYGYNAKLSGMTSSVIVHPDTVLLTADGGDSHHMINSANDIAQNRHVSAHIPDNIPLSLPGGRFFVLSYADGHVEMAPGNEVYRLSPN